MDDGSLFDAPTPARPKRAAPARVEWLPYKVKNPVRCSDCMQVLADNKGQGEHPAAARWKRRSPHGSQLDLFLCAVHARTRRAQERGGRPE